MSDDLRFDALLTEGADALPPPADVSPWRSAMSCIVWGIALKTLTLQLLYPQQGILGAARAVGHIVCQRRLRPQAAGAVERTVACQRRQPSTQRALRPVKAPRRLPQLHRYVGKALLPVPHIRQDGCDHIAQQGTVTAQQRLQGRFVAGGDPVHQGSIVHCPTTLPVSLPYYTRKRRKTHGLFPLRRENLSTAAIWVTAEILWQMFFGKGVDTLQGVWYSNLCRIRRCGGMVDTGDLKSPGSNAVPVRVRSPAPPVQQYIAE